MLINVDNRTHQRIKKLYMHIIYWQMTTKLTEVMKSIIKPDTHGSLQSALSAPYAVTKPEEIFLKKSITIPNQVM